VATHFADPGVNMGRRGEGGYLKDGGSLQHLGHECGHAAQLAVTGAHAREHGVAHGDARLIARHEAAYLRQQHDHADLRAAGGAAVSAASAKPRAARRLVC